MATAIGISKSSFHVQSLVGLLSDTRGWTAGS
jgi:hypothetical protein